MLGGCLLAFLLGIGGCVGCASCAVLAYDDMENSSTPRGGSDSYGYGGGDEYGSGAETFTLEEIRDILGSDLTGSVEDGNCSPGVYVVGADIDPGLYFLEGSPAGVGDFYVFDEEGPDSYELDHSIVYIGNYLVQLERGDAVAYLPGDEALRMYPIERASFAPEAPYRSGLYRVGTDIPAGEYKVTVQQDASEGTAYESAAYIMKDLEFDDDSFVDTKYVAAGGTQTIVVEEGQYLELFAAVAEPAGPAAA